jgi:mRNA-degrading endonuclease RelE of RelBE toxin-antitoxin system
MAYTVEIEPRARRQLRALPRDVQRRITDALAQLVDQPRPPEAKRLLAMTARIGYESGRIASSTRSKTASESS